MTALKADDFTRLGRVIEAPPHLTESSPTPGNGEMNDSRPGQPAPKIRLMNYQECRREMKSTAGYLIKGLVRAGTLVAIGARPGGGKTALMVELARCMDTGKPFLGRDTKQAVVAYIAAEDEADVIARLEATEAEGVCIVRSEEGFPLAKPDKAKAVMLEIIRKARERCPGRPVFVVVDTFRAALGGQSVLDDRITSPALNALREVAEAEGAVIAILNHTNRENPKQQKGETLEASAALELILLPADGDWYAIHIGKNRSGPGNRQIGRLRYTSVEIGGVEAAIVQEIVPDETTADKPRERKTGRNQRLVQAILRDKLLDVNDWHRPFGVEGPKVKAVTEEAIRDEFFKRKTGEVEAKRKAFTRALNHWIDSGDVARNEDASGTARVWFVRKESEQAAQA